MCAVEAQRCVDCVSAVLHAVLARAATLRALFDVNRRAWRRWTSCALVDNRLTSIRGRYFPLISLLRQCANGFFLLWMLL